MVRPRRFLVKYSNEYLTKEVSDLTMSKKGAARPWEEVSGHA
jgi:hypothetical protein